MSEKANGPMSDDVPVRRESDFMTAIMESQGDTITNRISDVTGSLPGSQMFINAKMAVSKFLKIFPGQEEIGSLTETFQMMTGTVDDKFFHGTLTPQKLQQALHMKGIMFSDEELKLVFPILDIDGDGAIDLDEFTHFGMAATISAQRISSGVGANPGTDRYNLGKVAVEKVLRLIPQHVLTYYSGKGELEALKQWLETVDEDGNGSIDPAELKDAMERFGAEVSKEEVDLIFPILDLDGDGSFDLEELTNFVKAATRTNTLQQRIVDGSGAKAGTTTFLKCKDVLFRLLRTVPGREELAQLKSVFSLIAPGGSVVEKRALQNCIQRFDVEFTEAETDLVFSVLDLDGDGGVDMLEFTEFVKACSTTTQRIQAGCGHTAGSREFDVAMLAVNKILSMVPGRDEMSNLVETFRAIDKDHSGQWSERELEQAVNLPQFLQKFAEAGLKPMNSEEVGLVYMVLDEHNHGAIDLDTFVEFFKQARTLGLTLAFDKESINRPNTPNLKALAHMNKASAFIIDTAKQEKEMTLSKLMGRVHKNERDCQVICMTGMSLKDAHVRSLTYALTENTNVRSLNLQYNDITDEGAKCIADYIAEQGQNCSIVSINLASNQLSEKGIDSLQKMEGTGRLRKLRFKGNPGYTKATGLDSI